MNLCVSGVFKERDNKSVKRGFSRVFVIVPFQTGFCIANEELFVTNATAQQMRVSIRYIRFIVIRFPSVRYRDLKFLIFRSVRCN